MMKQVAIILLAGTALLTGSSVTAQDGEKLFRKCKACHAVTTEKNGIGPTLKGVYDRPAASVEGYKYSKAMQTAGFNWDDANLDKFLEKPRAHVKGTKMAFPGVRKPNERRALIAYLKSVSE